MILNDQSKNHGSYVPMNELLWLWERRSALPSEKFAEKLNILADSNVIRIDGSHVYLEHVWQNEEYAAERLRDMLMAPPLPKPSLSNPITVGDIVLTDEQRDAVAMCLSHRLTLLLAKAGSGKTTIAQAIIKHAGTEHFLLCSPTGKAAKNLSNRTGFPAATIHRTLGVHGITDFLSVGRRDNIDLIIVDEGTMLTVDMLAGILRAASEDCRIVIIGDRNQLPAVGPGDVINDLVALGFPCASLVTNHRQSTAAKALRHNVINFHKILRCADLMKDESFLRFYSDDETALMDALVEDAAVRYTRGEEVQVLTLLKKDVLNMNCRIQKLVNPPVQDKYVLPSKDFDFIDGDRVILTANDYERGCYNGEVGILRVREDGSYFLELEDDRRPEWPTGKVPNMFLPAYAITIHRSQGSEYDSVLMYIPRCPGCLLHRNSFYTGISRAKRQFSLYANPKAVEFGLHTLPPERTSALVEKTQLLA